jgi:hypothetical protein
VVKTAGGSRVVAKATMSRMAFAAFVEGVARVGLF